MGIKSAKLVEEDIVPRTVAEPSSTSSGQRQSLTVRSIQETWEVCGQGRGVVARKMGEIVSKKEEDSQRPGELDNPLQDKYPEKGVQW